MTGKQQSASGTGSLKNVSSWSKIFTNNDAPSPALRNINTTACFEQFRRQAKEKEERVSWRLLIITIIFFSDAN